MNITSEIIEKYLKFFTPKIMATLTREPDSELWVIPESVWVHVDMEREIRVYVDRIAFKGKDIEALEDHVNAIVANQVLKRFQPEDCIWKVGLKHPDVDGDTGHTSVEKYFNKIIEAEQYALRLMSLRLEGPVGPKLLPYKPGQTIHTTGKGSYANSVVIECIKLGW